MQHFAKTGSGQTSEKHFQERERERELRFLTLLQRQWLDGSYKTYFRPLRQTPLPYPLTPGETVTQSVALAIEDNSAGTSAAAAAEASSASADASAAAAAAVRVSMGGVMPGAAPLPRIGVGVPPSHAVAMAKAMRASASSEESLLMNPQFLWCTLDARGASSDDEVMEQLKAYAALKTYGEMAHQPFGIVLEVRLSISACILWPR
eukprot:COSAG06_NODE_1549_length_9130_cov_6.206289_3_plen_206_part_00